MAEPFEFVRIDVPMRWSATIAEPEALQLLGLPPQGVSLRNIWSRVRPDVRRAYAGTLRRISSGLTRISFLLPIDDAETGESRQILVRGRISRHPSGPRLEAMLADLTQELKVRQGAEDAVAARADAAVRELNHRVRNIMSVVTALITLSSRFATDVDEFASSTLARIQALNVAYSNTGIDPSRPHLVRSTVEMRALASGVLASFRTDDHTLEVCNEPLTLSPGQASALGLILHELATNAVDHGALGRNGGRVELAWSRKGAHFEIQWTETGLDLAGGPFVDGFGLTIVKLFARNYLNGDARWDQKGNDLMVTISGLEN